MSHSTLAMSPWTPDPDFFIDTPRLILTHILPDSVEHCQCLVDIHTSSVSVARRLAIPASHPSFMNTVEKARAHIVGRTASIHAADGPGHGKYLVSEKTASGGVGRHVGVVSLIRTRPECDPQTLLPIPDVGFGFTEQGMGKGYATEAARALTDYAREHWGVTEFVGITSPTNMAARRVMEKLGLVEKGVMELRMFPGREDIVYGPAELSVDLRDYSVAKTVV